MKHIFLCLPLLFALGCSNKPVEQSRAQASETASVPFVACPNDPQKQALRSQELQGIVNADQAGRQLPPEKIDWSKVAPADEVRAKRVAEIFAEGCFKSAKDYAAAALVFQHGVVPDHYYQAYLWSKRALELGDEHQKSMIANTIDRYLINLGYKQIFGAQSFWNRAPNSCHCLQPTETKFSEKLRVKFSGLSLKDRIMSLHDGNKNNPACQAVIYCDKDLKSPPHGMFPGIW